MTCRVAFVIADHLNSVSGDAWPSVVRIANKLCVSTKTVQRCVKELEKADWLQVNRPRGRTRTNRYRPNLPGGLATKGYKGDKSGQESGQRRPSKPEAHVPQSYLGNLPKSYLEGTAAERPAVMRDQGTYEQRIISRLGTNGFHWLEALAKEDPETLTRLCQAEKLGLLSDAQLEAVISRVALRSAP
ncbi:helix-turn-helix domain-containing protein [Pseudorhodoplanes sinuspersici]